MIKCFYKKKPNRKTFFSRNLVFRSTAYGSEVLAEYLSWLKFYNSSLKDKRRHFWLAKQGDISNNNLFGEKVMGFAEQIKTYKSNSVLTPLFYGNNIYEIDAHGMIAINGKRSGYSVAEPKAWALTVLPEHSGNTVKLLVLGKSVSQYKMNLILFDVVEGSLSKSAVKSAELEATLEKESFLICFEKHIFAVHNSNLYYFYFNAELGELEQTTIREDKAPESVDCCKRVLPCIVADNDGSIFWCSDNTIYTFAVGAPRRVSVIENLKGKTVTRLQVADGVLFVYTANLSGLNTCYSYTKTEDGYIKITFNSNIKQNIVFGKNSNRYRNIAIGENTVYSDENGKTEQLRILNKGDERKSETYFLYGVVACGIRSAGYDSDRNFVLVE